MLHVILYNGTESGVVYGWLKLCCLWGRVLCTVWAMFAYAVSFGQEAALTKAVVSMVALWCEATGHEQSGISPRPRPRNKTRKSIKFNKYK